MEIRLLMKKRINALALGAQLKSSFCFVKNGTLYLSEAGGDLSSLDNFTLFRKKIKSFQNRFKIKPDLIACDLHPEYISTKYAQELAESGRYRVKPVQHHEAHVASSILDNNVKGQVIGVAFDGTGYGLDGNIWGGEFFIGNLKGLKRRGHLKYIPMPGGEKAVTEPWRMALSYLYNIYGNKIPKSFFARLDKRTATLIIEIIKKKINAPLTSSMGRLFDAVSSLVGICDCSEYEGQAAIELEKAVSYQPSAISRNKRYNFRYLDNKGLIIIDWIPLIRGIVKDLEAKKAKAEISLKFHGSICHMIKDVCLLLMKKYKINKVCLSGGVFQNKYLTTRTKPLLEQAGFRVYFHKRVPAHDGNIALGQAALAAIRA